MHRRFVAVAATCLAIFLLTRSAQPIPLDDATLLGSPRAERLAALAAYSDNHLQRAATGFRSCIRDADGQNDRLDEARCDIGMARVEIAGRRIADAVPYAVRALALLSSGTPDISAASISYGAGATLLRAGRAKEAVGIFTRGLSFVSGNGHAIDYYWQGRLQNGIARAFLDLHEYSKAAPHAATAAAMILKDPQLNVAELSVLENSGEVAWGFHHYVSALSTFSQAYGVLKNPRFRVRPVDRLEESSVVERLAYASGDANLQLRRATAALTTLADCRQASRTSVRRLCNLDAGEALLEGGHARASAAIFTSLQSARSGLPTDERIWLDYLTAMASLDTGDGIGAASASRQALFQLKGRSVTPFWRALGYFTAYVTARTVRPLLCGNMPRCARGYYRSALTQWKLLNFTKVRRYRRLLASVDAFDSAALLDAQVDRGGRADRRASRFERAALREARNGDLQAAVVSFTEGARERLARRDVRGALRDARSAVRWAANIDWRSRWIAARVEVLADEAADSPVAAARTCASSLLRLEKERSRAAFYARWNPQLRIDSIDLGVSSLNAIYSDCESQLMIGHRADPDFERLAVQLFNDNVGRRAFDAISRSGALHIAGVPNTTLDRLRSLAERYINAKNAVDAAAVRVQLHREESALSVRFPQLSAIMLPQAFSHPGSWQRSLTSDEAMLVDDISGNSLNVWIITPRSIRGVRMTDIVPTLRRRVDAINTIVRRIERSGRARRRVEAKERAGYDEAAQALARLLLPPSIAGSLARYRHVFVIPTGFLYRISYATLRWRHRYLAQSIDLAYLSSPSLLPLIRRAELAEKAKRDRSWFVAFADPLLSASGRTNDPTRSGNALTLRLPPLPDTAIEARRAAHYFPSRGNFRILSRAKASDASLMHLNEDGLLARYRYILFATHGVVAARPNRGPRPYIVLSHPNLSTGSGLLGVSDVMKLRLNARMVMLSTCDSGFSYTSAHEGEAEFGRAFMGAGARSVALTLWQITDLRGSVASGLLFRRLAKGEPPAVALRRTQIEMISHPRRGDPNGGSAAIASNPVNWGPYIVFGDGFNSSPAGT